MKLCAHCNAQFSEEHRRCVHCGRRLRPMEERAAPAPAREARDAPEAPDVSRLHHLTDDHPAKVAPLLDRLAEAGIEVTLVTDARTHAVPGYRGSSGWEARASLYVEPADREAAESVHRRFLEGLIPQLQGARPGGAESEACPACGEPLSVVGDACPACGLAFPSG